MGGARNPLLEDADYLRIVFDAFPAPVFVVDSDVRVLHHNSAASGTLPEEDVILRRGGEVLHCINSLAGPEGCGSSGQCGTCVIRTSVGEAFRGRGVFRRNTVMNVTEGGETREVHFLVSVSPFQYQGGDFSLLVLEDVSELVRLRGIIPVCAWCKRIRNDEDYWQSVEEYLNSRFDVDFTHGMCEECYRREFEELDGEAASESSGEG